MKVRTQLIALAPQMLKNLNITARTADDIVNAIKSKMRDKAEKFEFCIAESFPEERKEMNYQSMA